MDIVQSPGKRKPRDCQEVLKNQGGLSQHGVPADIVLSVNPSRVLVVEDDPQVRQAVERILVLEGHEVTTAVDGGKALDLLSTTRFDAIVMDVMMPFVDGLTACRELRHRGDRTPLLMLTARHEVGDRVAGLDAGADDYLVKPFAVDELLARVRALLRRNDHGTPDVLHFSDVEVDRARHLALRNGRDLALTKTEFELLALLMENQGRVLSRENIYEEIWGYHTETSSKSLDVYIGYLRRKLEEGGSPRILFTIRGVGYVIREDQS